MRGDRCSGGSHGVTSQRRSGISLALPGLRSVPLPLRPVLVRVVWGAHLLRVWAASVAKAGVAGWQGQAQPSARPLGSRSGPAGPAHPADGRPPSLSASPVVSRLQHQRWRPHPDRALSPAPSHTGKTRSRRPL